jgi:acetyltransferase-like isoleucine patch superfamily enzyme
VRALLLRIIDRWSRLRLAWLRALHPGLDIDPTASSNFAVARFNLARGARLSIGPGAVTDRIPRRLHFVIEAGAVVEIQAGTWLRTEVGDVHLVAFENARLSVGPDCLLNGCHLSAKTELVLGRRVWVGPGTRVFDADQHELDAARPEVRAKVAIDDFVWIASDCTVLRGARIGAHCVIGARSLVTGEIPPHTLAFGQPARPRGEIGDRSQTR